MSEFKPVNQEIEIYKKVKRKIDYNKVLRLLEFTPTKYQQEIIDRIQKADFNVGVFLMSRRAGKSTIMSKIALSELLIPNASILLVTPTFANAQAIFSNVEKDVNKLQLPFKSKDMKGLTFTLENGAKFRVVTEKNYENALGDKFSLVIFDETASINNVLEIWETYISPAQNDYGTDENGFMFSKTYFIGTPRTFDNDFYKLWKRCGERDDYFCKKVTVYDNPMITKEMIEAIKAKLDKRSFEQEYLCEFQSGFSEDLQVFYAFDLEKNVFRVNDLKNKMTTKDTFAVGIDIGFRDNTSFVIAWIEPMTGNIYVLDEYMAGQMPIEWHLKHFKEIEQRYCENPDMQIVRFCDPSASLTMADMAYSHNYYTQPAPIQLVESIRDINTAFQKGKLFISENCMQLIEELKLAHWKENGNGKTIERNKDGHFDLAVGALRYLTSGWWKLQNLQIQVV